MTTEENERPSILRLLKNGAWLDQQVFPELKWAVLGITPEGFGLLTGEPKLGKSWVTLGLALAVASGVGPSAIYRSARCAPSYSSPLKTETGGSNPGPVNSWDRPDPRQTRIRNLGHHRPSPRPDRSMARTQYRSRPLVILDTLGKVMPPAHPGEGAYQRDYRVGSKLKRESRVGRSIRMAR